MTLNLFNYTEWPHHNNDLKFQFLYNGYNKTKTVWSQWYVAYLSLCTFLVLCGSRFSSKTHHTNPYARENLDWQGERADTLYSSTGQTSSDDAVERVPWGGSQEESWRGREGIPMGLISTRPRNPSWQHDLSEWARTEWPSSMYWSIQQI